MVFMLILGLLAQQIRRKQKNVGGLQKKHVAFMHLKCVQPKFGQIVHEVRPVFGM